MKIKIIANRTGLGNQIQFIPVIKNLLKQGHEVYSDSPIYQHLGLCEWLPDRHADWYYVVFGYDWKKFWLEQRKYRFGGKWYGYKYRIKRRHISLGYTRSFRFNPEKNEKRQNIDFFCGGGHLRDLYNLKRETNVVNKQTALYIHEKAGRTLPIWSWDIIAKRLDERGVDYFVFYLGSSNDLTDRLQRSHIPNFKTDNIATTMDLLLACDNFIGTDGGLMHLADILGINGVVIFGGSEPKKNRPLNLETLHRFLNCQPCYNWGRMKCTNDKQYKCFDFSMQELRNLVDIYIR